MVSTKIFDCELVFSKRAGCLGTHTAAVDTGRGPFG